MKAELKVASVHSQRGMATLLTAVVLLIAVTGITFYMSESVLTEKRLVGDEYRAKQAFYAGQAGVDYGISYLINGGNATAGAVTSQALDNVSYDASTADTSLGSDNSLITVTGVGRSDDASVVRTLSQTFGKVPLFPNPPSLPVVSRGSVTFGGNLTVYNNIDNLTIWSGDNITSFGSTNTYISIDGKPDQLSTTQKTRGPDVVDGDQNLAGVTEEGLLTNFFGEDLGTWAKISAATTQHTLPSAAAAEGLIYIEGDVTLNDTSAEWGSATDPVVIVVHGQLKITGTPVINGIVVAQDLVTVGGGTINGGMIATNSADFGAGNFSVRYQDLKTALTNKLFVLAAVNGSWKDWSN